MPAKYMPFRPNRPQIHCSLDTLFHAGVLWVTRSVAENRKAPHG